MSDFLDPSMPVAVSRGIGLPHWFQENATTILTFRLADAAPALLLRRWQQQREGWLRTFGIEHGAAGWQEAFRDLAPEQKLDYHTRFTQGFQRLLDEGHGACALALPAAAALVAAALDFFDGVRYDLGDFVIMPNHVHVLFTPLPGFATAAIGTSWKRFTAPRIQKLIGGSGKLWQHESHDHLVRNAASLEQKQRYIAENPRGLAPGTFFLRSSLRQ